MQISIANAIQVARRIGAAAAEVITTNLKMWLGFETSETLGREEVVNGDFATDSDWIKRNGSTTNDVANVIANGDIGSTTSNWSLESLANVFQLNKTYRIKFRAKQVSLAGSKAGPFQLGYSYFPLFDQVITNEFVDYEVVVKPSLGGTVLNLTIGGRIAGDVFQIDDISVKELTQITPDKSGNNNVGELFTGKALEFDGANDYVNTTGFEMSGTSFTFAFWIYPRATSYQFIMDLDVVGTDQRSILALYNNTAGTLVQKFGWYNNPGGFRQFGDPIQNEWQRVVFRLSPTTVECYVNGVQSGTTQSLATAHNYSNINNSVIGGRNNLATTQRLDSNLSDFQIYNAYWSVDDIAFDYANPNILVTDSTNTGTSIEVTNLKAYWAMSEGAGSLAYDSANAIGVNVVTDGDFPLPNVNWVLVNEAQITVNGLKIDNTVSGNFVGVKQFLTNNPFGKTFVATYDVIATNGAELAIQQSPDITLDTTTIGTNKKTTFIWSRTLDELTIKRLGTGVNVTIDNFSLQEISVSVGTIIGATYDNSQPRIPQLGMQNWSKGSNLFPYSEDFTEWINSPSSSQAVLAPTEAAPYGQGDVYEVTMLASESDAYIRYSTINATLTSSTHSVWVKQAPSGSATHIRITNNNRSAWNTGTSKKIALTSSWQRLETTDSITGNRFTIIGSADVGGIKDPDCLGKALVYGAQLVEGSSAGVYRFTDGDATSNSTVIANPTTPTQDIFGNAVRDRDASFNLDGVGHATIADSTSLNISNGTLQFWLKTTDTAFTILSGQSSSEFIGKANVTWFNNNAGTITVYKDNVTSSSNNTPDTDGNWHFYTFTGINVSSWTAFEISNLVNFKLDGLLDSVFIYSDVLTSAEIIKNYNFTEPDHQ